MNHFSQSTGLLSSKGPLGWFLGSNRRTGMGCDLLTWHVNLFRWKVAFVCKCHAFGFFFLALFWDHVYVGQNSIQDFKTCLFVSIKVHHFLARSGTAVSCCPVSHIEGIKNPTTEGGQMMDREENSLLLVFWPHVQERKSMPPLFSSEMLIMPKGQLNQPISRETDLIPGNFLCHKQLEFLV